jgi:polysaccharide biosynthesis protein PslH
MLGLLAPEHQVTLLTPRPAPGLDALQPSGACAEIVTYRPGAGWGLAGAALRGQPLQSGLFQSADLRRALRRLAPQADLAVLQLVRLAAHRGDLGDTPVVVDLIDDLALNFTRRAAVDRIWLRPLWAREAGRLLRAERRLAQRAAGVLLVCDRDRHELARHLSAADSARIATVGLIVEPAPGDPILADRFPPTTPAAAAPNGDPTRAESRAGSDGVLAGAAGGLPRLVFTGNLGYFVNADAISWWLREIWPALAARHSRLCLQVAGDRPAPAVRRAIAGAGSAAARISLIESAPDLRRVLAGATAALAPMRCGSGIPIKILEAWAAGVPVVASSWAAAGTTGVPGEDFAIADTPQAWLDSVSRLLDDPAQGRQLARNGRRRLLADFSRERIRGQLMAALARAGSQS